MSNIPRFCLAVGMSMIIDREDNWKEIGTYQDIAAEVLELREENARLRLENSVLRVTERQESYAEAQKENGQLRKTIAEIGTLHEWAESERIQEIAELRSEIARLRGLLPDAETRQAIRDSAENAEVDRTLQGEVDETLRGVDYYRPEIIFDWLDKLDEAQAKP